MEFLIPKRLPLEPLMDYGYEGAAIFPFMLMVAKNPPLADVARAVKGDSQTHIQAHVRWLVCREVCVPGMAFLGIDLPRTGSPETQVSGDLIASAIKAEPAALPQNESVQVSATRDHLALTIKTGQRETYAEFYPLDEDALRNAADQIVTPNGKGALLRLERGHMSDTLPTHLKGVLKSSGNRTYLIDVPVQPMPLSANTPSASSGRFALAVFLALAGGLVLNLMRGAVIDLFVTCYKGVATMHKQCSFVLIGSLTFAMLTVFTPPEVLPQASSAESVIAHPSAVLVELFTSEGCSSCPSADELLRQVNGNKTAGGQLIVGISEHVSYWNGLGWKDPFSADLYTSRQNEYGTHFQLGSVYTPQMIVNGREQFVGSDRRALEAALATESQRKSISLRIDSAQIKDNRVTFTYTASDLPAKSSLQLVVVLVDDMDQSSVHRGENSGRKLTHVAVARALAPLGSLHEVEQRSMTLPLPPSFLSNQATGHHLILFAQQSGAGAVVGVDTKPI